jgi:hypothetical protein
MPPLVVSAAEEMGERWGVARETRESGRRTRRIIRQKFELRSCLTGPIRRRDVRTSRR